MPKVKTICFVLVVLLLAGGAFFQHQYIKTTTQSLIDKSKEIAALVERNDLRVAKEAAAALQTQWQTELPALSTILDHEYIDEVSEQIKILVSELAVKNFQELPSCVSSLTHSLEIINHFETINLENIL